MLEWHIKFEFFGIILSDEKVYVNNLTRLRPHSIILGLALNGIYIGRIRLVNPYPRIMKMTRLAYKTGS